MDLVSYVSGNIKNVYQKVIELYQLEIEVDANGEQVVSTLRVEECQTDVLNRQTDNSNGRRELPSRRRESCPHKR